VVGIELGWALNFCTRHIPPRSSAGSQFPIQRHPTSIIWIGAVRESMITSVFVAVQSWRITGAHSSFPPTAPDQRGCVDRQSLTSPYLMYLSQLLPFPWHSPQKPPVADSGDATPVSGGHSSSSLPALNLEGTCVSIGMPIKYSLACCCSRFNRTLFER
jgi:hypothetical protein